MKLNKLKKLQKDLDKFNYTCKKNCFECCCAISFLPEEEKLMKKELLKNWYKKPPNWKWNDFCEYLTKEWKCSVYKTRPIVCRSFWNIWFLLKWNWKKILTRVCTYAKTIVVQPSKEFMDYWDEVIKKWILNKNAENIINNLEESWKNIHLK